MLVVIILIAIIGVLTYLVFHSEKRSPKAAAAAAVAAASIRPRDGLGRAVDWFVVFKLPNHALNCSTCADSCACTGCAQPSNCSVWDSGRSSAGDRSTGECYYYADSNNSTLTYYTDLGFGCLSDDSSPLQQTMAQLNQGKWALWNDQGLTSSCSAPNAHSKGAVCYDQRGGFILNTSSPHWPNSDLQPIGCQKISNSEFAQHMFCFSASSDAIDGWLQLVQNASLCITESSFLKKGHLSGGSTPSPMTINTLAGVPITAIVKGSQDNYLPWSVVSETLQTGIEVASWTAESGGRDGWGDAPIYNNGHQPIVQITDVSTPHGCFRSVEHVSHSKWAISDSGNWVVFGSMNMQNSQAARGGDFYGFQNQNLWASLKGFISGTMPR